MSKKRMCAVCGDTNIQNVKYIWRRTSDGALFNICVCCRENHRVNSESVDNFGCNITALASESMLKSASGKKPTAAHRAGHGKLAKIIMPTRFSNHIRK